MGQSPTARVPLKEGVPFSRLQEQLCSQSQEEPQAWLLFCLNGALCTGGLIRLTENTNLPHRLSERDPPTNFITLLVDEPGSSDITGDYMHQDHFNLCSCQFYSLRHPKDDQQSALDMS